LGKKKTGFEKQQVPGKTHKRGPLEKKSWTDHPPGTAFRVKDYQKDRKTVKVNTAWLSWGQDEF